MDTIGNAKAYPGPVAGQAEETFTSALIGRLSSAEDTLSSALDDMQTLHDRLFGAAASGKDSAAGSPFPSALTDNIFSRLCAVREKAEAVRHLAKSLNARI